MKLISKDALEAKLMLCMDMNRADWSYNKMILGDCSVCGERVHIYTHNIHGGSKKYKICPYCGAIMDKEDRL